MNISKRMSSGICNVMLTGKFTFDDHLQFRQVIQKISENDVMKVVLNMSGVEFVDSAALGMLLLARDAADKHQKTIAIEGAKGQVKKMLDMSRFNALFTIN